MAKTSAPNSGWDQRLPHAHAWLKAQRDQMAQDLIELANQNSGSNNLDGLQSVASWLVDWMQIPGTRHQRLSLPTRNQWDDSGEVHEIESGPLLIWEQRPAASTQVLLGIHFDTVYGPDHGFRDCRWLNDNQLNGPGVADAKGGIVVLRYALQALALFELHGTCGWTMFLNPDEEIGSPGSSSYLVDLCPRFHAALLFEPALPSGALVSHRKGSGVFTIVMRGRSAHAGRHIDQGRNAVVHLARLIAKLDDLNFVQSDATINVGRIVGGGPVNVVPDLAVARVNVRIASPQAQQWFDGHLQELVDQANALPGFQCQVHGGFHAPVKSIDDAMRNLMNCVELSAERIGTSIHWQSSGGVSDGNRLAAAGLPTVDTLGPLGDHIHSPNEIVYIDSLVDKARLLVELMSGFGARRWQVRTLPTRANEI